MTAWWRTVFLKRHTAYMVQECGVFISGNKDGGL